MERQAELPMQTTPHDSLRQGLPFLKADSSFAHPVEAIQQDKTAPSHRTGKGQMLANLYGTAAPAKLSIEAQILSMPGRLPGIPSSKLGLDSWSGALDDFGFEHFLGDPGCPEQVPVDPHSAMEAKLGLSKPMARGFV